MGIDGPISFGWFGFKNVAPLTKEFGIDPWGPFVGRFSQHEFHELRILTTMVVPSLFILVYILYQDILMIHALLIRLDPKKNQEEKLNTRPKVAGLIVVPTAQHNLSKINSCATQHSGFEIFCFNGENS